MRKLHFVTTCAEAVDPDTDERVTVRLESGSWCWTVDVPAGTKRMSVGRGTARTDSAARGAARRCLEKHRANKRAA